MPIFDYKFLCQCIADTLCYAAFQLSVNAAWIDNLACIMNGDEPFQRHPLPQSVA